MLVILCVEISLHIAACFTQDKISKILCYVNIALHSLMVLPLMMYGFDLDESVLLYLISATVMVASRFVKLKALERRKDG